MKTKFTIALLLLASCTQPGNDQNPTMEKQQAALEQLESDIKKAFGNVPGVFALAFKPAWGEGGEVLVNAREEFHAASTMKTPVMFEIYRQAEQGNYSLDTTITVVNEFKSIVDGSPYSLTAEEDSEQKLYEALGEKRPLKDLIYDMIIWSSNLATNIVIELAGPENTTNAMKAIGAENVKVLRGVEDIKAFRQGLSNTTDAHGLMVMYDKIARGEAVSPEASEAMIAVLLDQKFNDMIPAKLPEGTKVAHKTGFITRVRHDSGIVFMPGGRRYSMVLLSKEWEDQAAAVEMMATVSRMVYDYAATLP